MKDTDSVDDFALRMKTITNEIRLLGEKFEESNAVRKFLRAVPSKFLEISSAIEQFGDLKRMTMDEVTGRLKAHEERLRGSTNEKDDGQLLLTRSQWIAKERGRGHAKSTVQCWKCQELGHIKRYCPNPRKENKEQKEKGILQLAACDVDDDPRLY